MSSFAERSDERTHDNRRTKLPLRSLSPSTDILDAQGGNHPLARNSEIIAALPAAIYTTDALGRITYCNEAAAALWGCRPELGKSEFCGSWRLCWPDGTPLPHDQCPMALALKQRRPNRGMEAIAERPDGTRVPFIAYPTPLFDASGALTGAVNMLVEISERKRAELLSSVIENADDAIVGKDLTGIVTSWNKGAERLFGYTALDMIGKSITILIPEDRQNEEPEILGRIRRGEAVQDYETVRRRKDGRSVDISLRVSPIKDQTGRIVGASKIARDISERKHAQARQELLSAEVQHRTRNLFAVVCAVVANSFAGKDTVDDAKKAVISRLHSLADTHLMLDDNKWEGADMAAIVCTEMKPYGDRVTMEGPKLSLTPKAARNFAMAVHELGTNAAKYGALSNAAGQVHISWSIRQSNGEDLFNFHWREHGGPPVIPPKRRGFGSIVLERILADHVGVSAQIEFTASGLTFVVTGALDAVTVGEGPIS
jgi:two-component system CheB/CheR fusion protein